MTPSDLVPLAAIILAVVVRGLWPLVGDVGFWRKHTCPACGRSFRERDGVEQSAKHTRRCFVRDDGLTVVSFCSDGCADVGLDKTVAGSRRDAARSTDQILADFEGDFTSDFLRELRREIAHVARRGKG